MEKQQVESVGGEKRMSEKNGGKRRSGLDETEWDDFDDEDIQCEGEFRKDGEEFSEDLATSGNASGDLSPREKAPDNSLERGNQDDDEVNNFFDEGAPEENGGNEQRDEQVEKEQEQANNEGQVLNGEVLTVGDVKKELAKVMEGVNHLKWMFDSIWIRNHGRLEKMEPFLSQYVTRPGEEPQKGGKKIVFRAEKNVVKTTEKEKEKTIARVKELEKSPIQGNGETDTSPVTKAQFKSSLAEFSDNITDTMNSLHFHYYNHSSRIKQMEKVCENVKMVGEEEDEEEDDKQQDENGTDDLEGDDMEDEGEPREKRARLE